VSVRLYVCISVCAANASDFHLTLMMFIYFGENGKYTKYILTSVCVCVCVCIGTCIIFLCSAGFAVPLVVIVAFCFVFFSFFSFFVNTTFYFCSQETLMGIEAYPELFGCLHWLLVLGSSSFIRIRLAFWISFFCDKFDLYEKEIDYQ